MRLLLEDEGGYLVTDTADTEQALTLLHSSPQRLVVLFDYRMPRQESAALVALAEREVHLADRHAFVCMTTTDSGRLPTTLKAMLARYDVPLLAKPFDIAAVLAALRQAEQRSPSVVRISRVVAADPKQGRSPPLADRTLAADNTGDLQHPPVQAHRRC